MNMSVEKEARVIASLVSRLGRPYIPEKKILLLLGGNKNGQDKDIRQPKKILRANIQG
jgi:hypothetical protein